MKLHYWCTAWHFKYLTKPSILNNRQLVFTVLMVQQFSINLLHKVNLQIMQQQKCKHFRPLQNSTSSHELPVLMLPNNWRVGQNIFEKLLCIIWIWYMCSRSLFFYKSWVHLPRTGVTVEEYNEFCCLFEIQIMRCGELWTSKLVVPVFYVIYLRWSTRTIYWWFWWFINMTSELKLIMDYNAFWYILRNLLLFLQMV